MKKEDLLKLGLEEEMATEISDLIAEELKGYIPKSRFDEVNEAKKKLEGEMKERDKQLESLSLSAGANEELKAEIQRLQEENKASDKAHKRRNTKASHRQCH